MIVRQSLALLLDAYRELNSRRLFWVSLVISAFIVAIFAALGISANGISFLWWNIPMHMGILAMASPALFYKVLFIYFGLPVWLTWAGMILALVSTAGIVPEMLSAGTVELMLARPVGRVRLLLTKFFAGLFFVALQTLVFTGACVLVIGLRGHEWDWRMFLAVPVVCLSFTYLYSICVFVGVLTRSSMTALITTCLVWIVIYLANGVEWTLLQSEIGQRHAVAAARLDVESEEKMPEDQRNDQRLDLRRGTLLERTTDLATINRWHTIVFGLKTVLPKTVENNHLLTWMILNQADYDIYMRMESGENDRGRGRPFGSQDQAATAEATRIIRDRSGWWSIGTSLTFEAVVLSAAAWLFKRRDF